MDAGENRVDFVKNYSLHHKKIKMAYSISRQRQEMLIFVKTSKLALRLTQPPIQIGRHVKLATYLHFMSRPKTSGDMPPFSHVPYRLAQIQL